jgi:hypothetical protein
VLQLVAHPLRPDLIDGLLEMVQDLNLTKNQLSIITAHIVEESDNAKQASQALTEERQRCMPLQSFRSLLVLVPFLSVCSVCLTSLFLSSAVCATVCG